MTWGSQNTVAEGCAQIDQALEAGVDFLDTAEMYPTNPRTRETAGDTESVIGEWIKTRKARDKLVIATKVIGARDGFIRDGAPISAKTIDIALDGSLRRLNTDYVDLYQLHWPNRGHYHFRRNWSYDPTEQPDASVVLGEIEEILTALDRHIRDGKIRAIGLSNETAWGLAAFLRIAERDDLPRIASIQNEYSLMYRLFDTDLAEISHYETVPLLSYSSLAAGLLTGKYRKGAPPPAGSRGAVAQGLGGRVNDVSLTAAAAYADLARRYGLEPAAMAYAFCLTRPFIGSVIIGATTPEQLRVALSAADVTLPDELLTEISALHRAYPTPF